VPWFGNQYFDPDKKKWRTGRYLHKARRRGFLLAFAKFLILSLVVTLVLSYFFPGIRAFFMWW